MRLVAHSQGHSLVVLPRLYSRCIVPQFRGPVPDAFALHRANLVQTGVEFSGSVDVLLRFAAGPLGASSCRLEDLEDARRWKLVKAATDFPLRPEAICPDGPSKGESARTKPR